MWGIYREENWGDKGDEEYGEAGVITLPPNKSPGKSGRPENTVTKV